MATISQITSSTVTATGLTPSTLYTLYTAASVSASFSAVTPSITFTTPAGATTYSFTYTPTSGTYLGISSGSAPNAGSGTLYTDPAHGISTPRLSTITNVTTGSSFDIACASPGIFYNLTTSALTGFKMAGVSNPSTTGVYFVLRNNVSNTFLSLTPTSDSGLTTSGITSPLVIPPGTSAILVWNGTNYTMF